jgi:FAD binding domain-containing protein
MKTATGCRIQSATNAWAPVATEQVVCPKRAMKGRKYPLLPPQYISTPGACGKTPVVVQSLQAERTETKEWRMAEHAVVIAGGGPTGMMLAADLALAKVDVAVVGRRPNHVPVGSRAGGLHSRTIDSTKEDV